MTDYSDDFGKHTTPEIAAKIRMIWDSIPTQIARDNSKFIFSHVKKGARAKDLEDALTWLVNAGIVLKLDLVATPEIPLSAMADSTFFWRTKADAELDFITDYEGKLIPIEVKSADNTRAKSLHLFCNRYNPQIAFKSSLKNVGDNMDGSSHVWSLPLYAFYRFKQYVNQEFGWD